MKPTYVIFSMVNNSVLDNQAKQELESPLNNPFNLHYSGPQIWKKLGKEGEMEVELIGHWLPVIPAQPEDFLYSGELRRKCELHST